MPIDAAEEDILLPVGKIDCKVDVDTHKILIDSRNAVQNLVQHPVARLAATRAAGIEPMWKACARSHLHKTE